MSDENLIGTDIQHAAELLRTDQLVAIPTETVYGLAGNALSSVAVTRIFEAKNRPQFNPLIAHTDSLDKLRPHLLDLPALAEELAKYFWPGPLTMLLPRRESIPDLVTAGHPRVAVRVPDHPMALELLAQLDFPLAAPSANPFGYISPTTAEHVAAQLGQRVSYILDGGPAHVGVESTIIGFEPDGSVKLYRMGGTAVEDLEAFTGPLDWAPKSESNPQSSGMLKSHYAPDTPLILGDIEALAQEKKVAKLGLLTWQANYPALDASVVEVLSEKGDVAEAASRLFAALRRLDAAGVDLILAEPVPNIGLGRAINDRLHRAEAERKS